MPRTVIQCICPFEQTDEAAAKLVFASLPASKFKDGPVMLIRNPN